MQKTSNAVWALLLLSCANAANTAADPGFATATIDVTAIAADAKAGLVMQGKKRVPLRATKNPVYLANAIALVAGTDIATCSGPAAAGVATGTESCLKCIKNVDVIGVAGVLTSVWCSGAWNYSYESLPIGSTAPIYPHIAAGGAYTFNATGGNATVSGATLQGELGSCCYNQSTANALYTTAVGQAVNTSLFNSTNCPAKFSNDVAASSPTSAAVTIAATSWWCSDGTYNQVSGANTTGLGNLVSLFTQDTVMVDKTLQTASKDRRNELFYAACRQKKLICGDGKIDLAGTGAALERTVSATGFNQSEKCTWVMNSTTKAPTFKISTPTAASSASILPSTYDVIYQEWVEGWNTLVKDVDYKINDGTNKSEGIIYPHIAASIYGTVAKYNYVGTDFDEQASLTNNDHNFGSAFVFVKSSQDCVITTALGNTPAGCIDNGTLVKQRWFNASEASSGLKLAQENLTAYNSLKTTFNTSATAYNAYLAALVTPPDVKPTQVMRPTSPTVPAAFTGLQHWSGAKQKTYQGAAPVGSFPAWGTDFIAANRVNEPGWGAWTISRIAGGWEDANVNFITHSFGNVGVHQGPDDQQNRSWVKNYFSSGAAVAAPLTAAALKAGHTIAEQIMCAGATENNACTAVGTTATALNTKNVFLTVSIWSNELTYPTIAAYTTGAAGFKITFKASDWGSDTLLFAPAAATAPTVLTAEPAFAQTLTASAVAVIAIATALY